MPSEEVKRFIGRTAAGVAADWWTVSVYSGMTVEEYEALVAGFRRDVEDGIRAGRVRLLEQIQQRKGGA